MPFVKLDCGILNSTLWFERLGREIFITALLMAEPLELTEEEPQIAVRSLDHTGWKVPPGDYGFVPAAGIGIIRRAMIPEEDVQSALDALAMLGDPEQASRTQDFEGRRMVRIDGGFIILNFDKYRERDYTAAARQARYRERKRQRESSEENDTSHTVTGQDNAVTSRFPSASSCTCTSVLKEGVRGRFEKWIKYRKANGKKVKNWDDFFADQAAWLAKEFSEEDQIEVLEQSMRNGWIGLFEPKRSVKDKRLTQPKPRLDLTKGFKEI